VLVERGEPTINIANAKHAITAIKIMDVASSLMFDNVVF
jgi:hypothetical protein